MVYFIPLIESFIVYLEFNQSLMSYIIDTNVAH